MKISRKTRLIGAGLVIAVAGTVGGVVAAESSPAVSPLCTPVALSELMGHWQDKESQATSYTQMQAIYGAGMTAELQRGKLCDLPGFG